MATYRRQWFEKHRAELNSFVRTYFVLRFGLSDKVRRRVPLETNPIIRAAAVAWNKQPQPVPPAFVKSSLASAAKLHRAKLAKAAAATDTSPQAIAKDQAKPAKARKKGLKVQQPQISDESHLV